VYDGFNLAPLPATDVFVIGGGPAGLAAAIAARRRGFRVTVADSGTPPIDKACGEGIMPDGVAAARSLGIPLDTIVAQPFRGIRFRDRGVTVEACFPAGHGLGLRRTALHPLMAECAARSGVRLEWGARISGISARGVFLDGRLAPARWIVGADGGQSGVRRWAGLDAGARESRRFGFRRHYQVAATPDFVEIEWGDGCQFYITPVAPGEICVALISRDQHLRLDDVLPSFPDLARRLRGPVPAQRGGVTSMQRLRSVTRRNVALAGDASGSVDAIAGEGLCLLFQQAVALAAALEAGDLALYATAHRRLARRPRLMAELLLMLDRSTALRRGVMRAMAWQPGLFARMLDLHAGIPPLRGLAEGLAWGGRALR
jgi:flavin-dependent dehydrogenase